MAEMETNMSDVEASCPFCGDGKMIQRRSGIKKCWKCGLQARSPEDMVLYVRGLREDFRHTDGYDAEEIRQFYKETIPALIVEIERLRYEVKHGWSRGARAMLYVAQKFINFHYKKLSTKSPTHRAVRDILRREGLSASLFSPQNLDEEGIPKGIDTLELPLDVAKNPAPENKSAIPPKWEWVSEYCQSRSNTVDPQYFCDYYQSTGWMIGKHQMKDWRAAVRTWEKNNRRWSGGNGKGKVVGGAAPRPRKYAGVRAANR
jgi:hypothetical protein